MSIWVKRMNGIATTYIHPNQSGFLKNRHIWNNIIRICNIIHSLGKKHLSDLFYFVDAEKAFDHMEWSSWSQSYLG